MENDEEILKSKNVMLDVGEPAADDLSEEEEIGRASCRERV